MLQPLRDLVGREAFQVGLLTGVIVAVVCTLTVALLGRRWRPIAFAGGSLCIGAVIATKNAEVSFPHGALLALGLAVMWAVGWYSAAFRVPFLLRAALFVPGAVLVAQTLTPGDRSWVPPFLVVFMAVGGAAAADWSRWAPVADAGPLLALLAVAGVYACVPDTEHAALVLGVAIPIACTGWPMRFMTVGSGGAAAIVGLVAWLAGTDGTPRSGAVVGACACVGVLMFVPLLDRSGVVLSGRNRLQGTRAVLAIVGCQALVVAACSRVAGLVDSIVWSALIAAVALGVTLVLVRACFLLRPAATPGPAD